MGCVTHFVLMFHSCTLKNSGNWSFSDFFQGVWKRNIGEKEVFTSCSQMQCWILQNSVKNIFVSTVKGRVHSFSKLTKFSKKLTLRPRYMHTKAFVTRGKDFLVFRKNLGLHWINDPIGNDLTTDSNSILYMQILRKALHILASQSETTYNSRRYLYL